MSRNSLDLKTCTGESSTCPVTQECRVGSLFFSIEDFQDPEMDEATNFYRDFILKCELGICPGKKLAQFTDALQLVLEVPKHRDP